MLGGAVWYVPLCTCIPEASNVVFFGGSVINILNTKQSQKATTLEGPGSGVPAGSYDALLSVRCIGLWSPDQKVGYPKGGYGMSLYSRSQKCWNMTNPKKPREEGKPAKIVPGPLANILQSTVQLADTFPAVTQTSSRRPRRRSE